MNKPEPLQPPAETCDASKPESASRIASQSASQSARQYANQEPMQQWRNAALNSSDVRDRIAVSAGLSRGIFGCLHLGGVESASNACNDSDYESGDAQYSGSQYGSDNDQYDDADYCDFKRAA